MKPIHTSHRWALLLTLSGAGRFLVRARWTGAGISALPGSAPFTIFPLAEGAPRPPRISSHLTGFSSPVPSQAAFRPTRSGYYHATSTQHELSWQQSNTVAGAARTAGAHPATPALLPADNVTVQTTTGGGTIVAADERSKNTLKPITNTTTSSTFTGYQVSGVSTTGRNDSFGSYRSGLYSTTDAYNQFSNFQSKNCSPTARPNPLNSFERGQSNTVDTNSRFKDGTGTNPMRAGGSSNGFTSCCYNATGTSNQFSGYLNSYRPTTDTYTALSSTTSPK